MNQRRTGKKNQAALIPCNPLDLIWDFKQRKTLGFVYKCKTINRESNKHY